MSLYSRSAIVIITLMSLACHADQPLRLSISEYKPWIYQENDNIQGIVYDMLIEVANRLDTDVVTTLMPYKRTYASLASGQADMNIVIYSDYTYASDYPEQLHIGDESLFALKVAGVSLLQRNLNVNSHTDLTHLRLGGRRIVKTIYRGFLSPKVSISEYADHEALLKGLLAGRIDFAILSMESFGVISKSLKAEDLLEVSYHFPVLAKLGIGWSKSALGDRARVLSAMFSEELRKMKRSGKIAEIINRYSSTEYFSSFGTSLDEHE